MSERIIEATIAVRKLSILNPGTIRLVSHKSATFIKKAAIPKVKIEIGKATICTIGLINVFTTPITIAATTAAQMPDRTNPGIRYATTKSASTFIANFPTSFTILIMNCLLHTCQLLNVRKIAEFHQLPVAMLLNL